MHTRRRHRALFNYVALAALVAVVAVVLFEAYADLRRLEQVEQTDAERSAALAIERVHAHLDLLRSEIAVLSYREIDLLRAIFRQPDDFASADLLTQRVVSQLPGAFAVMLADTDGTPLIPDFDGLVGEICQENIRQFARTRGDFQVRVHPNPFGYHFDVMVPFDDPRDGHRGIFFVSFHLDRIVQILRETQLAGHQLILLFEPTPDLIEVHPHGGRETLQRDARLSPRETGRVLASLPVHDTMWRMVDLPEPGLLTGKGYVTLARYAGYVLLLALLILSVAIAIRREAKYLAGLEAANRDLEVRVEERTAELAAANRRVGSIIENTTDAIVTIDQDQVIQLFNPGAERMFGYRADEVLGQPLTMLLPESARAEHGRMVRGFAGEPIIARPKDARSEIHGLRKDGVEFPAEATICKMQVDGASWFTAFVRDVSDRKAAEAKIKEMAMTDELTGLANRRQFQAKLLEALEYAERFGHKVGVMLLDLDDFKPVNDTYGHQTGDAVLKQTAAILAASVRKVDVVGRMGGDEFSLVINGVQQVADLERVAAHLLEQLQELREVAGVPIRIGASMGLSLFPDHAREPETLLGQADEALYAAKRAGKHTFCVYDQAPVEQPDQA